MMVSIVKWVDHGIAEGVGRMVLLVVIFLGADIVVFSFRACLLCCLRSEVDLCCAVLEDAGAALKDVCGLLLLGRFKEIEASSMHCCRGHRRRLVPEVEVGIGRRCWRRCRRVSVKRGADKIGVGQLQKGSKSTEALANCKFQEIVILIVQS